MATLKTPQLYQLLLQARYAPYEKRLQQLNNCEALIGKLQADKSYPFEFICYQITGFHPKSDFDVNHQVLISGEDLLADIPIYAARLSREMKITSSSINTKIYTMESLTTHFRVCQKTITRWRKKGLVGRYLKFPDGRLRLAFSETMVNTFVEKNHQKVNQGRRFSQISAEEKQLIIDRLLKWSQRCPHLRQEAIRRTARKFGRSVESIRLLLVREEGKKHSAFSFLSREDGLSDETTADIARLYRDGVPVEELMKRFNRSKSNIYHAINKSQSRELLEREITYIPGEEFENPETETYYLAGESIKPGHLNTQRKRQNTSEKQPAAQNSGPLAEYIRDIAQTDLLTAREEKFLFGKYNYLKYLARQTQQACDPDYPSARMLSQMRLYLRKADEVKDLLIRSNLRLVVSIARRHTRNDHEMAELISEGNLALMNAVEKFDITRNVKFSTYATWAIVKKYATYHTKKAKMPEHETCDEMLEVAHDLRVEDSRIAAVESARKSLHEIIADILEEREQTIVTEHYGLIKQTEISGQRKSKSLAQIASVIGISKERVRQIELVALKKLRQAMQPEQFDLLIRS